MPRRKRSKTKLKLASPLQVTLLLTQFILAKIGSIPIIITKTAQSSAVKAIGEVERLVSLGIRSTFGAKRTHSERSGHASGALRTDKLSAIFSRKRGRPRTTPFIPFYYKRLKKFTFQNTSRRARIALVIFSILILFSSYTTFVVKTSQLLPSPTRLITSSQPLTTEFYDRNGKLLYRLYEGRNRTLVNLQDLPKYLVQATIATEDKNFYLHPGFDILAIVRAVYHNFKSQNTGQVWEGASTITQQLIKNTLLTPEKTFSRKIKEVILAFWAERIYSKDQILQMYLNEAPYGGPTWGVEAGAQTYFGKNAKDLNLAEAAFLAGLPASPTQFSPYGTHPELTKARQAYVLDRMVSQGYITDKQRKDAIDAPLNLKPLSNNILAPHFVFFVKDLLAQRFGERVVSQGGLKIKTTLDLNLQESVEKIVQTEVEGLSGLNVKNGAAMITDPKTGQILAMVGSRDYHYPDFGNFNATISLRQPGSSIKVITYATAFKKGYSPGNSVLDAPVEFKDEWGNRYAPQNYDGSFHGPVSIRTALGSSLNIPAVKMLATVGVDSAVQTARDLGITTFTDPKNYGLALTLGGADVKMIDMMGVYGALSQLGQLNPPTPILKVTDSEGNILEEYQNLPKQALEPGIAYLLTSILSDNNARSLAFGTNSLLNISPNVAVKTGTSDNKRDNWTFGYTNDFTVGVWVGNNDNSPMNQQLTSGITGAAPIWNKIMKAILDKHPALAFKIPDGIIQAVVDGRKDLMVAGNIPKGLVKITQKEDKITFSDLFSVYATSSAQAKAENGATN